MPKRPGGDGVGPSIKPKNQDRYWIKTILRSQDDGNYVSPHQLNVGVRNLINTMERTGKHGNFSAHDRELAQRLVKSIRHDNNDSDANKKQAIANRLHRALKNTPGPKAGGGKDGSFGTTRPTPPYTTPSGGAPHGNRNSGGGHRHGGKGHGGKGRSGGRGGGRGISYTNASYSETPGLRRKAANLVDADIADQLRTLLRGIKGYKRQEKHALIRNRTQGQRTRGDLRSVFGEVADYLQAQNGAIDKNYDQASTGIGNTYDRAGNVVADNAAANRDSALQEQQRLGIEGSGLSQFDTDAANNAAVLQQSKANALSGVDLMRSGASAIGSLLGGAVQGEQASAIGKSWNLQDDNASDIRSLFSGQVDQLRQQAIDTRLGRGGKLQQLLMALEDQDYSRWAEQSQNNFLNQMAVNNFNLNRQQFNTEQQWRMAQLQQQIAAQRRLRQQQQGANLAGQIGNTFSNIFGVFG